MPQANPYAPPAVEVTEPVDPLDQLTARRISRFAAALIDMLSFCAAIFIPLLLPDSVGWILATVAVCVVGLVDIILLARDGQTLGKRALRIRIVRSDGTPATLGRLLLLRMGVMLFIGLIPLLGTLIQLADPLFIFGNASRCLHDYLADTRVVVVVADRHSGAAAESWAW